MDFNSLVSIFTGGVMPFKTNLIGIISLLLFFIVFTKVCFPQNESYLDSLDGKFALQFQISDNFNLTNFQGTTFSGKYHLGKRDAVRLGLSLDFGDSELDGQTNQFDTVNVAKINATQNSFGFNVKAQYIKYLIETNTVAFFSGVGPFFSYNETTNKTNSEGTPEDKNYRNSADQYSLGLDLLLGVEWFFTKNMSLSAEYGLKFMYRSRTNSYNSEIIAGSTNETSYSITGNDINFGISVYF